MQTARLHSPTRQSAKQLVPSFAALSFWRFPLAVPKSDHRSVSSETAKRDALIGKPFAASAAAYGADGDRRCRKKGNARAADIIIQQMQKRD